jgi:hypothetical protein
LLVGIFPFVKLYHSFRIIEVYSCEQEVFKRNRLSRISFGPFNGILKDVNARNQRKGVAAIEQMLQEIELEKVSSRHGFGRLTFLRLDLSSLDSVSEFAKEFNALDIPLNILVLNAGIMKSPGADFVGQNITYGEAHIGVNHIAHSHLTHLLLDQLKASAPSRVVTGSSMAEMGAYEDGFRFDEWKIDNGIMPESMKMGKHTDSPNLQT